MSVIQAGKQISLPPVSVVEVIELQPSMCVSMWVCETYVVHHLVSTGLHCAPLTCIVHHGAQGGPMSVRSGGRVGKR